MFLQPCVMGLHRCLASGFALLLVMKEPETSEARTSALGVVDSL